MDDGSTDDTVAILESYRERLPLRVIDRGRVGNWVAMTNRGLAEASGRYGSILHQDDLWLPGRLAALRAALSSHPDVMVIHPVWFLDAKGARVGRWRSPLPTGRVSPPEQVMERLLVQNSFSLPGTVFPLDALGDQGLDERLWYTADWDLWLRLAARLPVLHLKRHLAAVRVHGSSITTTQAARVEDLRRQHEEVLRRHLPAWGIDGNRRRRVESAGRFSVDVNVTLAALASRRPARVGSLILDGLKLGPLGWGRYVRNSRIHERVGARLRAGLGRRPRVNG